MSKSVVKSMNGKGGRPKYTAVMGHVFDVSGDPLFDEGHENGWYNAFVGRDSSRAWATGDLGKDRKDDVDRLEGNLLHKLDLMVDEFKAKYAYKGLMGGGFFYSLDGRLTLEGRDVELDLVKERKSQAKKSVDKRRYPSCKDDGATLSCANGKLPRLRRTEGLRCTCVIAKVAAKHDDDFVTLEDCADDATSCTKIIKKHKL